MLAHGAQLTRARAGGVGVLSGGAVQARRCALGRQVRARGAVLAGCGSRLRRPAGFGCCSSQLCALQYSSQYLTHHCGHKTLHLQHRTEKPHRRKSNPHSRTPCSMFPTDTQPSLPSLWHQTEPSSNPRVVLTPKNPDKTSSSTRVRSQSACGTHSSCT